jgi:quercetin dioxygenase-like cupin family protein
MAHQGQSIHNPDTGQRMTLTTLTEEVLELTSVNPPTERAEPRHRHPRQQSTAQVHSGHLTFDVEGEVRRVGPGESIAIPAGAVHTFWNDGPEEAHSAQSFRPALRTAEFFETYFALAAAGELNGKGMPGLLQLAVMIPAFGDEMRATQPPWPLQRALAAVLGPIARRRGYRPTRELA